MGGAGWQAGEWTQWATGAARFPHAGTTKQGRAILAVAASVSTGNRTCLTFRFLPAKQEVSVIFAAGLALDTDVVLAYDGPVLKRFYDEFGPRLSSSAARLSSPVHA